MLSWWKARPRYVFGAICVLCTIAVTILHLTEARYSRSEERVRDWLATSPAARKATRHPSIAFLGLDKSSIELDALFAGDLEKSRTLQLMKQGMPWSREVYAHIIDRLASAGAKAIVFDIRFPGQREGDEIFRNALNRERDRVVIGSNFVTVTEYTGIENEAGETVSNKPTHELPSPTLIPPSSSPDNRVGFVTVLPDSDNIVRKVHYRSSLTSFFGYKQAKSPEELSLAARALEKFGAAALIPQTYDPVRIRFAETFHHRPLYEIFVDDLWRGAFYKSGAFFKDKIVLIGASGNEAEDRLTTPFGTVLGPMIHLSAINAALQNDFLWDSPWWADLGFICAGGFTAWILSTRVRRPLVRLALLAAAALTYYAVAQTAFNVSGFYPILLSPLVTLATSGITCIAFEQVLEQREKARIRRTFERYVSKDVVKEVLDNPQSFLNSLGGERRPVTVLFSDVRGFTTATESADPTRLVSQLNEYFHEMVRIVRVETRGTLDKFIGDAVMAHWGSIVSRGITADANSAVAAALTMRRELARLNKSWEERGLLHFAIGIGINHGEVVVGNIGSNERAEVSVIGDAVNLASRLEGVTKPYHVDLCIGESVAALVKDTYVIRSLDLIVVKGKTKPVEVFTVLHRRDDKTPEPAWLAAHEEAMQLYRRGKFADAARCWREVLAQEPGDGVAKLFIERCEMLQQNSPEQAWSGAWEMKDK